MATRVPCATLSTKVLPGTRVQGDLADGAFLHSTHFGAQHLVAFATSGNANDIVIVETNSMQVVQTLSGHNAPLTSFLWRPQNSSTLMHSAVQLFSGDRAGIVALWDVAEGVMLRSLRLPVREGVAAIALFSSLHLAVVGDGASFFTFEATLSDAAPLHDLSPYTAPGKGHGAPLRLVLSPLCGSMTSGVVLADKIIFVGNLRAIVGSRRSEVLWSKELIFEGDGSGIVDACFSCVNPEILYIAQRNGVACYDWRLDLVLTEQVVWMTGGTELRCIFPSSSPRATDDGARLPVFYTFSSDNRLAAWYVLRAEKLHCAATDVRGTRINGKTGLHVTQCEADPTLFSVVLTDSSVCKWRYDTLERVWSMEGYLENTLTRPSCMCSLGGTQLCVALDSGCLVLYDAMFNRAVRKFNIVHSGTTKIVKLCTLTQRLVLVGTSRTTQYKHYLQVAEVDVSNGELRRIIREAPSVPEISPLRDMTVDNEGLMMLLLFNSGAFEVWNIKTRVMVFLHSGAGIIHACWGPSASVISVENRSNQLVAAMLDEGGVQYYVCYADRLVRQRETFPLRLSSGSTPVVTACAHDCFLVCFDGSSGGSVIRGVGESSKWALLSQMHKSSATQVALLVSDANLFVAVCFEDGACGVWDIRSRRRVGFSVDCKVACEAISVQWVQDETLAVLQRTGSIIITTKEFLQVNSSVLSKALRHPMLTPVFMLPKHATYLQTSLELSACALHQQPVPAADPPEPEGPSFLMTSLHDRPMPCRGSFGQLITAPAATLEDELALYASTMVPPDVEASIEAAAGGIEETAEIVAKYFAQGEKRAFWATVRKHKESWERLDASHEFNKSSGGGGGSVRLQFEDELELAGVDIFETAVEQPVDPVYPAFIPSRYSFATSDPLTLRLNRSALSSLRIATLQASRTRNFDDSEARLQIARDCLVMGDLQKACDVLIDSRFEYDAFSLHATLAIAISAAMQKQSPQFVLTAKRAAAMLLAKSSVDEAVEKFCLIGEHYEACLALQSVGRWSEAAITAQLSNMNDSCRAELAHRWATHCAQRGDVMPAVRMLLGLKLPRKALVLLADRPYFTDVAGLFAVALSASAQCLLHKESIDARVASPIRSDDEPHQHETVGEVLHNLLVDYKGMLESVGNFRGLAAVAAVEKELASFAAVA